MPSSPLSLNDLAHALELQGRQSQFLMLEDVDSLWLTELTERYDLIDTKAQETEAQLPTELNLNRTPPSTQSAPPTRRAVEPLPRPLRAAPVPQPPSTQGSTGKRSLNLNPQEAKNLDSLHFRVRDCEACGLCLGRRRVVFGQGNQHPLMMVIGDQPVAEEDLRGLAFVSEEQAMLDKVLYCLGLSRPSVYQTRMVKCRPDGDREASPPEITACLSILNKQIDLLAPKLILTLGRAAFATLVPEARYETAAKGKAYPYRGALVMGIDHLGEVMGNPEKVPLLWEDLRRVRQVLGTCLVG